MRVGTPFLLGLALALILGAPFVASAQTITRGPYIQQTSDSGAILRWRTSVATDSRVNYGPAPSSLTSSYSSGASTTEHVVQISGLGADTRYYYSVGTSSTELAGNDANHHFTTSPTPGTAVPTRIWVLGDSGTADANARAVRDAYYAYTGGAETDLWLMLGDNAYPDGTDSEFQAAVFDTYPTMLRRAALWPTLGNHDGHTADSATQTGAYYDIFSLPKNGEAGGLPSGTEAYYSFDYGDIHFISLESYETDRSPSGAMLTWLENDLAANTRAWTIAFWHHPPYSKGSHDSDTDTRMSEMRQNANAVLEDYGVDLVLGGHSHAYERSKLIDGHYGVSGTLTPAMVLDGSAGNDADLGPYEKDLGSVRSGAVYAVAGSSGKISGGALNHPAMYVSINQLGSMVLEINGNRLNATFLNSGGATPDTFSIVKGLDETPPLLTAADAPDGGTVTASFSEALDAVTAEIAGNYALDGGASVSGAALEADGRTVTLSTSALTEGQTYTLSVANVEDLAGNAIAAGAEAEFVYQVLHTMSFQAGVAPDGAYAGARDTSLSQNAPGTNYGGNVSLFVDGDDPAGSGNDVVAMMAWDVSDIPADATVQGATITINVTNVSSGPYEAYELLSAWQEASATWTNRAAGTPWGGPGASGAGDRAAAVLGAATGGVLGAHSIALNADGLDAVQGWIEGGANNGLILANSAVTNGLDFSSREDPDPGERPRLTVTYTLPVVSGDTQAPDSPVNLAAGTVTETSVALTWTPCAAFPAACDNVGVTGYSVYRDAALVGTTATPDFTDTGLTPDTEYDYDVTASDAAGNVSAPSLALTVSTDAPPALSVLVNDITMALRPIGKKKHASVATIMVHDGAGQPAAGATVNGSWSGIAPGTASGVTGSDGLVTLESGSVNTNASGRFVFAVTGVSLSGYGYDPADNVESGDCIDTDGQQCGGGPGNLPPTAAFTAPASCEIGQACNFTDGSSDPESGPLSRSWSFGDGGTSSATNPSHVYACPTGARTVSLTVTDDGGLSDTASKSVNVTGDCGGGGGVTLSEVASNNNGGTWTATVRVTADAVVGGSWSGGASGSAGCTPVGGSCDIVSPSVRKKEGSVTYTATTLDGAPLSPTVSVTVLKP